MNCIYGCVKVETILQQMDDRNEDYTKLTKLSPYKCWRDIENEDYGHLNYAVMAYAVKQGHISCLKMLYEIGADWHEDLLVVAKEEDQLECLKYISETMEHPNPNMTLEG